jgi:pSer/pThr/pTyr-binding forkhead associated (FHA) protein
MLAIAVSAIYTTLRKRGTTRQLATTIVVCVACALFLLPAVLWYNMRLVPAQLPLPLLEVQLALVYVTLCGWLLPLSATTSYCLFAPLRLSTTSTAIPSQSPRSKATAILQPPRHQPGVLAPFVVNEETPWAWLEYRNGNFQGQRLALKRSIITFGRDEDNDIWIDDDMASRHHAELAWNNNTVILTDCDSLNGVILNGKRISQSVEVKPEDQLEIGSQRFLFLLAERQESSLDAFDPLTNHKWRSSLDPLTTKSKVLPVTRLLQDKSEAEKIPTTSLSDSVKDVMDPMLNEWQDTSALQRLTPPPIPIEPRGALFIQNGESAGKIVLLDRPILTIGRGIECNIVMNDASISRQHAQFSRQASGDYVQDLTSRNGTLVNNEPLTGPRLLQHGDRICLGTIELQYTAAQHAPRTPMPQIITPRSFARSMSGPVPLKLPSKQKESH